MIGHTFDLKKFQLIEGLMIVNLYGNTAEEIYDWFLQTPEDSTSIATLATFHAPQE